MAVNTTVSQPARYQGDNTSTKYVNKVAIAADGSMTVTATAVAKSNILPTTTTTASRPTSTNQIVSNTKSSRVAATTVPGAVKLDGDGVILNPQPPGPPGI